MSRTLKSKIVTGLVGAALSLGAGFIAPNASATVILTFSQAVGVNTVTGTQVGGSTTISGTDIPVSIGFVENVIGSPAGFLDFTMLSADQAVCQLIAGLCVLGSDVLQHFSGTFSINSAADGSGTNYLSGSFVDSVLGHGGSLTLSATTPPGTGAVFASGVVSTLGEDRAIAFSFTNVSPPVSGPGLCNPGALTLCSFTSSVSGNMSAGIPRQAPEPATVALLGLALAGLGFSRRKQK